MDEIVSGMIDQVDDKFDKNIRCSIFYDPARVEGRNIHHFSVNCSVLVQEVYFNLCKKLKLNKFLISIQEKF